MATIGKMTVASAAVLLVLVLCVNAQTPVPAGCNEGQIMSKVGPCLSESANGQTPVKEDSCCLAILDIKTSIQPSPECMCATVTNQYATALNVTKEQVATLIGICDSPDAIPDCLKSRRR